MKSFIFLSLTILCLMVPLSLTETAQISVTIWRRGKALLEPSPLCLKEGGAGFAYHNETKTCYKIGEQGPCDTLMKFSKNITFQGYGNCVCDFYKQCGRPVVQWPDTGKCYFVNEQGPCPQGQWLTLTPDKTPMCTDNECQDEETKIPSVGSKYWFSENGTCYQTNTRGYCENENALLLFTRQDYKPTCNYGIVCGAVKVKDLPKIIKSWNLTIAKPRSQPSIISSQISTNGNNETVYTSIVDIQRQFKV